MTPGTAPLLLVDGDSMIFRAFFALPKSIKGADGKPVNALLGTVNLVLREVERHEPRAVVFCLGAEAAAYRVELYSGYHADRPELPPELGQQYEIAQGFLESFGWAVTRHDSLEADDLLGAYARREAAGGGRALIMTGDRDMFQCASDRVGILYVSTGKEGGQLVDPDGVRERYGIPPDLVPDFIALRGDPSDGIPGAKGIGPKTAAELLVRHGSLEAALDAAMREERPSVRGALLAGREELPMFKELASLQDVEVEPPPDTPTDYGRAAQAAAELGMKRLSERLEKSA
jgi:DNA polymerase-1